MKSNRNLARILDETAKLLTFKGENFYRIRAFTDAAQTIKHLEENIDEISQKKKLEELPKIGLGMAKRIEEYLMEGDFKEHRELISEIPHGVLEILEVPGMGPKKAKVLYEKLGIKDINDLRKSILEHKLKDLESFGEKTESNILEGIKKKEKYSERILMSEADEIAHTAAERLKAVKGVERVEIAGSLRRRKETIGDIDILYISNRSGKEIGEEFTAGFHREDIIAVGDKKASFIWDKTCQVDIRSIDKDEWGSALQYFTGSKEHNVTLRKHAIKNNLKLNEYGVFRNDKKIAGRTEAELYKSLGMDYIVPELRENFQEIDASINRILPDLVEYDDIIGDTHIHSLYSDGDNTIEEIALKAESMGYEWVAVCDHSKSLKIANGLDEDELKRKIEEIKTLNEKLDIKILCAQEVDIKKDGSLDYSDDVLKELDLVIAAIHTGFNESEEIITGRVIKAMENPSVHIIAHPTGRLINVREPYKIDIHAVINKAYETHTAIEINAHPQRLDLYYYFVKEAKEKGVKLAIGTDAHNVRDMKFVKYGLSVARRGWLEKDNLINTMSFKELCARLNLSHV